MKKLLTLTLLLASMLTFSACGGDDNEDSVINNEPETPANPYIGTWEYIDVTYDWMQKGYFEIAEDNTIKQERYNYRNNKLESFDEAFYTYTIENKDSDKEILLIKPVIGRFWLEAKLLRGKLIVFDVYRDEATGEEIRTIWTEMTRYDPVQ